MWIDIEDASGTKQGPGPITTASRWRSTRRLDAAGAFSFVMPAGDARAELLQHKRIARCWTVERGTLREIGAGVIDEIMVRPQPGGRAVLEVSGEDLLRELVNIQVGELELFDRNEYKPYSLAVGTSTSSDELSLPGTVDLEPADPSPDNTVYLYVTSDTPFNALRFDLGASVNSQACELQIQYWVGETEEWANLNADDGTAGDDGVPWSEDGVISWYVPDNWTAAGDTPVYTMRIYQDEVDMDAVDIETIVIVRAEPTGEALQRIMALAPLAWSLDAMEGELQTDVPVYLQMAGETILAALVRLAQQTGEHFALGVDGRTVRWLGRRQDSSGLRAIAPPVGV